MLTIWVIIVVIVTASRIAILRLKRISTVIVFHVGLGVKTGVSSGVRERILIWMLGIARHQKLGLVADAGHNELDGAGQRGDQQMP